MTKKNRFYIFVISGVACGLAACNTAPTGTARIIEEDQSQLALLLNKDLSVTVVGLKGGTRVEPCKLDDASANSDAATQTNPNPSDKLDTTAKTSPTPSEVKCRINHGEILSKKTYTITVVKGSCCGIIDGPGIHREVCSPPDGKYPVEFINKMTGQQCK